MKKLIIACITICLWSVSNVCAQADSTLRKTDPSEANQPGVPQGYVVVRAVEIPTQLQTALQAPEYFGWDKGSIFYNRVNNQYLVEVRTDAQPKRFFFDRNGNPVRKP